MMTPERFEEVVRLYRAAMELDVAQRPQCLAEACAGDEALRAEVTALLNYDRRDGQLLDRPALELAARVLEEEQTRALTGRHVGHCRLLSLLGKGGMGEVWLAEDTQLGRKVAVKLLPAAFTHDAERVRRFVQEARAASALNHPNIITIHEIGATVKETGKEDGGIHYLVTEYVQGETLRQRMNLAPQRQIGIAEALDASVQIAAALTAAHTAGIVHRDIKPENVMLRTDGLVKVLDFGLAKLTEPQTAAVDSAAPTQQLLTTESGMVMGTPRYMSPEQARGERVDERSDIFSLGVMLYEMIAGRAPFCGATPSEVVAAILRDVPPPLRSFASATPPELQHIVNRALQKDCEARYPVMPELLGDLKRLKRQLERQDELPDESPRTGQPAPASETPARGKGEAVSPANALEPAGSRTGQAAAIAWKQQILGKLNRHKLAVALTLLLVLVAVAVYFNFFAESRRAIDSLAVLPFVNVAANPDTEYLSDGITDSLINGLSQLPKLKVMSRNSVFRYKGTETDAQQAGTTLGVRAVLTGKVTQRGNDLLISVELVDVRDNSHLWGEQYNHKLADLSALQAELARDISQQLRLKLSGDAQQRLTKRDTENPEAYELYLKGRYALNAMTPEGYKKALEYFQQAIEKDPRYALGYAGLADCYAEAAYLVTTSSISPREAYSKAKDAALMAVKLDDTLAEAHTALGKIAMLQEWDWKTAEREFKRAIALNPNYVPARHWYSHYLIYLGRIDESLVESQRALELDPLDVGINHHLGFHYFYARQYDQAVAQLQKTLDMNRNHTDTHGILGGVYEQQGRYQEAIAEMQKIKELGGEDARWMMGHMYASSGRSGEAEKLLAQLQEEAKHRHVSPFGIAMIHEGLGQKDQAFAWLEKAYTEHDSSLTNLKADPRVDSLRADSRFTDLLRRMGIPQ
jgi:serine/threonine-protein kinase